MRKSKALLSQPEFHILLLVSGFVLLSWPIMSVFDAEPAGVVLGYLFLIWALLIVLLYFIHGAIRASVYGGGSGSTKESSKDKR